MIKAGANIDFIADDGNTALHKCVFKEQYAFAEILIEAGANLNQLNNDNKTPLDLAIEYKKAKMIRLFMQNGGLTRSDLEKNKTNENGIISDKLEVEVKEDGTVNIKRK